MYSPKLQSVLAEQAARRQRAYSLRWSVANAALLLLLLYDMSGWHVWSGAPQLLQMALACSAALALARHARALLPAPRPPAPPASPPPAPRAEPEVSDASLSLSTSSLCAWRSPPPPPAPPSPPAAPPSPSLKDEFIADKLELEQYLSRSASPHAPPSPPAPRSAWLSPPVYQLAARQEALEPPAGGGAGSAGGRLPLDPRALTEYNLNLRRWIHMTIIERVVREIDSVDAALARRGLSEMRIGQVSVERLRALCGAEGAGAAALGASALPALLPYLQLQRDQRALVTRLRALARGGCLRAYRWRSDADLLAGLLGAYLGRAWRRHCSAPPAPPAPPPALRRSPDAPHYLLLLEGREPLEVSRGQNNLFDSVLLLLAALAARSPPVLGRLHLGPAGLNLLWVLGR